MSGPAGFPFQNPANGKWYRVVGGDGGVWHDYADGSKVFVANPQPVTPSGGTAAPAPAPIPPVVVSSTPQPTTGSGPPPAPPQPVTASGGTAAPAPASPFPNGMTPAEYELYKASGMTPEQYERYEAQKAAGQLSQSAGAAPTSTDPVMNAPFTFTGGDRPFGDKSNSDQGGLGSTDGSDPNSSGGSNSGTTTPDPNTPIGSTNDGTGTAAPVSSDSSASPAASGSSDSNASAPAPAPASGGTHTVVHGDTMWGIAQATGIPLARLEALNPQIQHPELIFPGQQINLGGASDAAVTPAGSGGSTDAGGTHTVVHGDTMWGIAQSHGMPLSKLESLNPQIQHPELIFPGQQINLGGGASTDSSAPAAATPDSTDSSTVTQSSVVFPKTSSYQTPGATPQLETDINARPAGWGGGTGSVPADPVKGVIEVVTNPSTDPLKINENKSRSV